MRTPWDVAGGRIDPEFALIFEIHSDSAAQLPKKTGRKPSRPTGFMHRKHILSASLQFWSSLAGPCLAHLTWHLTATSNVAALSESFTPPVIFILREASETGVVTASYSLRN